MSGQAKAVAAPSAKKAAAAANVVDTIKELLADDRNRIKLDDYVTGLLKQTLATLAEDPFWNAPPQPDTESIPARYASYEAMVKSLFEAAVLLARWGRGEQVKLLSRILARLAEPPKFNSNFAAWASGRFYPCSHIMYGAGISAIACGNYPALAEVLLTTVVTDRHDDRPANLVVLVGDEMNQLSDIFKAIPAYKQKYFPRSEHMFKQLQQPLEDMLYLGSSYAQFFDEYEMLSALVYADLTSRGNERFWAAPGRFAWTSSHYGRPYNPLVKLAEEKGAAWPPIRAGLFASPQRFQEVAKGYAATLSRMKIY